jgi:ERF superfamily
MIDVNDPSNAAMCALYKAMAAAQSAMGPLAKDAKGNFGKYATLASVIEVVLPPLCAQGIAVIQMPETSADGVTLITLLCHEGGGVMRTEITMKPAQNTPQGIGSTITYARRYSLMAIAGVAPDDDDGTAGSAPNTARNITPPENTQTKSSADDDWKQWQSVIHDTNNIDELRAWATANRPDRGHRYRSNFDQAVIERIAAIKEEQAHKETA